MYFSDTKQGLNSAARATCGEARYNINLQVRSGEVVVEGTGGEAKPPRRDCVFAFDPLVYTSPCAIIARATLMKPAMLAPTTKFPGDPNSSAASEHVS